MMQDTGFVNVGIGPPMDTFGCASGEQNSRAFEVLGYAFIGQKPEA